MPTTANEYRRYAKECIDCAREAKSDRVRKRFLDLAKLWMTSAERMDAHQPPLSFDVIPDIKANGHKPAKPSA
jgi:hypothetical protein